MGVETTAEGIDGWVARPDLVAQTVVAFDATSAGAHARHAAILAEHGVPVLDLTPAALGPFAVPPVNGHALAVHPNLNLVTCGGQAVVPLAHAVSQVVQVHYAEMVSAVASRSAGPGTRANIDEFTQTTSRALREMSGAEHARAVMVLNPAEPPVMMRNTLVLLTAPADETAIRSAVAARVAEVQTYAPGYRLVAPPLVELAAAQDAALWGGSHAPGALRITLLLEVEGAGFHLPPYAGNLDIMTAAAVRLAETLVAETRTSATSATAPIPAYP